MKGVLIYAFNNTRIDYFRQAVWCADRANRFLDLPVTIVTDSRSHGSRSVTHDVVYVDSRSGGQRVYNPTADESTDDWLNGNRSQSWMLSPYDETIVLDSDYVICSDQLLRLFDSPISVTAIKEVYDITGRNDYAPYKWISSRRGLHHYWATVLFFKKDQISRDFFDMMEMIWDHYRHYSELYRFPISPFRNDHAASIALNTVYGHVPDSIPAIPWKMANAFSDVEISAVDDTTFDLYYTMDQGSKHVRTRISGQDFHFMNKVGLSKLYEN